MDLNNINNDEILSTDIDNLFEPKVEPMTNPQPVMEPMTNLEPVQPVMEPMYNPEPVQPVMEPMTNLEPVQPVMEPMTNPEPVQPVMEPMTNPEPVQPVMEPMTNLEPVQPVMEPMYNPEPVQPVMEPMTNPEPVQPVMEPITNLEPVQPVMEPMMNPEPVQPVMETINQPTLEEPVNPEPEKKSSVLKVLLMIILVLAIMAGGYYIYTEFFAKPEEEVEKPEELEKESVNTYETWNAIYKKDEGTSQLMLFASSEEKASLMLATEIDFGGNKGLQFPIQYHDSLTIRDEKLHYYSDDKEQLSISKNNDKITITFVGEEENIEDYADLVGTYTKTKVVKTFDSDAFEIK